MASSKAVVAAKAVNSLLHLSSSDQESLLAVVEDYFTTPDSQTDDCDSDLDGSADSDLAWYTQSALTVMHDNRVLCMTQSLNWNV